MLWHVVFSTHCVCASGYRWLSFSECARRAFNTCAWNVYMACGRQTSH